MQTEHYMANMNKPGHAERLRLLGLDEQWQMVAALDRAPGRSAEARADGELAQSGLCPAQSSNDVAQPT